MLADVLLPLALPMQELSYRISDEQVGRVALGKRVVVEVGRRRYVGIVTAFRSLKVESQSIFQLKDIIEVLDERPEVSEEEIAFWRFLSFYYMVPMGDVLSVALPESLLSLKSIKDSQSRGRKLLSLNKSFQSETFLAKIREILLRAPVQKDFFERFLQLLPQEQGKPSLSGTVPFDSLVDGDPNRLGAFRRLQVKLETHFSASEVFSISLESLPRSEKKAATAFTSKVSEGKASDSVIPSDISKPFLYWAENDEAQYAFISREIQANYLRGYRTLLILPQSSTPEGEETFVRRLLSLHDIPIVFYTGQTSQKDRVALRRRLRETDEPLLVIGSRLATFIPSDGLGLVIIAEEQDLFYKQQEPSPRFHARDCLVFRTRKLGIPILLSAVTPSLETLYNVKEGKYHLLGEAPANFASPKIDVVNLKREREIHRIKYNCLISKQLRKSIGETLDLGERVLLLAARRGYAPFLHCYHCGESIRCRHCDVTLTYHRRRNRLVCPYCGYSTSVPNRCPKCEKSGEGDDGKLYTVGFGSERIEQELQELFPKAQIVRVDAETTTSKVNRINLREKILDEESDIYVGTSLISRFTSLHSIGLIAIPQLDLLASYPDFRNDEQIYGMILRLTRRYPKAKLLFQTQDPRHPLILRLCSSDPEAVFRELLQEREFFGFPPYQRLIRLILKHSNLSKLLDASSIFVEAFYREKNIFAEVRGPLEPSVSRVNNLYLRHITLRLNPKARSDEIRKRIKSLIQNLQMLHPACRQTKLFFDVDPY